jgi:hypothetical protein
LLLNGYSTVLNSQKFLSNQIVEKPEQREMQPWGEVSSIPDANTVFGGQQINGQTDTKHREEKRREGKRREEKREHR